jgi:hypothetical protein
MFDNGADGLSVAGPTNQGGDMMDWLFEPIAANALFGHGFTPALMVVGAVMYLTWTAAYLLIIRQCFREQTYGVPMVAVMMNIVWEFCFSFDVLNQNLALFFVWGNRLWFFFDVVIVYQLFKWGRGAQAIPPVRDHFYKITIPGLAATAVALPLAIVYVNDLDGIASSFTMNLSMSIMFPFMIFFRPGLEGLNYPAAWLKMIGTAAGAILCVWWYPAQFENGLRIPSLEIGQQIPEPPGYGYLNTIYILIFIVDCIYIYLLRDARRKLANA